MQARLALCARGDDSGDGSRGGGPTYSSFQNVVHGSGPSREAVFVDEVADSIPAVDLDGVSDDIRDRDEACAGGTCPTPSR